jgi:hypothetical protein
VYEFAEVNGKVVGIPAADYRRINAAVEEFVAHLRSRPGVEVIQTKLPFATDSQSSLSGDIGAESDKAPVFTVAVARKLRL